MRRYLALAKYESEWVFVTMKRVFDLFVDTRLLMDYEIPSYDQMIIEMVEMRIVNKSLYSQYEVENFGKE